MLVCPFWAKCERLKFQDLQTRNLAHARVDDLFLRAPSERRVRTLCTAIYDHFFRQLRDDQYNAIQLRNAFVGSVLKNIGVKERKEKDNNYIRVRNSAGTHPISLLAFLHLHHKFLFSRT